MSAHESSAIQAGSENERQWLVAQLGAREHYAVPRALARDGQLAQFYTDAWCRWGRSVLRQGPDLLRAFANRYHPELASESVTAFNVRAIWNVARRRFRDGYRSPSDLADHHVDVGAWFGRQVRRQLETRGVDPGRHAFFGFSTGCYEVLKFLRDRGVLTVVDQVSPGPVEHEIVAEEEARWPDWVQTPVCDTPALHQRVEAEWEAASLVLVNSEWSRTSLVEEGVPDDKIIVVPGAYEPPSGIESKAPSSDDPLQVLWLGNVVLRKGIPYLVQAARELGTTDIEITVAGPIGISERAVAQSPPNITFVGPVPRDRVSVLYRAADVFVLPTLSDGFGITQVEAMAHGCPVIATPNCGRVVTDGEDGWIIPARSAEALVDTLFTCAEERDRVVQMGEAARRTAKEYTLDVYAQRLRTAVSTAVDTLNVPDEPDESSS